MSLIPIPRRLEDAPTAFLSEALTGLDLGEAVEDLALPEIANLEALQTAPRALPPKLSQKHAAARRRRQKEAVR